MRVGSAYFQCFGNNNFKVPLQDKLGGRPSPNKKAIGGIHSGEADQLPFLLAQRGTRDQLYLYIKGGAR